MTDETTKGTREDAYDAEIAPLMTKIIEVCKQHEIPMLATFQFTEPNVEDPGYCTTMLPGTGEGDALRVLKSRWLARSAHVALAITEVTEPDGRKRTTVRRVG